MISKLLMPIVLSLGLISLTACHRSIRSATDITPGNTFSEKLDWRYGLGDIRIQTNKLTKQLMDQWFTKTCYNISQGKPRLILTEIDNRTNQYISTDMIRDIFECSAIDDGRFTVVVGDFCHEEELDYFMNRILTDPKYSNSSRIIPNKATAPQFLAKVKITNAITSDRFYDYEDYRMTVTLYDIETQEAIDSLSDVLSKKIRR